jgi:hypothetical protein
MVNVMGVVVGYDTSVIGGTMADEMHAPVAHLRWIVAIIGMQIEPHGGLC